MTGTVLVTGGASGIGAATCAALAAAGWQPVPADLHQAAGGVELDVRDERSWAKVMREVGPLDGLVACAGVRTRSSLLDLSVSDFDHVMDVNVRGVFLGMQAAARSWTAAGRPGVIVNVASVNGVQAIPGQAHYIASKAAVMMLTKAAALELAASGTRVNAVAPGAVRTPLTADRLSEPGQAEWIQAHVPLGRIAEADEVAPAIVFLLSDASGYITGTTLFVDGGWAGTSM